MAWGATDLSRGQFNVFRKDSLMFSVKTDTYVQCNNFYLNFPNKCDNTESLKRMTPAKLKKKMTTTLGNECDR